MSVLSPEQFQRLLPLAVVWAEKQERYILDNGISLQDSVMADAKRAGVAHPEHVRILAVPTIPLPEDWQLRSAAEATSLITPSTYGITFRYGIFIRSDCLGDRHLLVHELAHTAQYERLGGMHAFISQYLWECNTIGYPLAPLEQEAVRTAAAICQTGDV